MLASKLIKNVLPKAIQPLLDLVGPSFFKAVPWLDLTAEGRVILAHLAGSDSKQSKLAEKQLQKMLLGRQIELTTELVENSATMEAEDKKQVGEKILELYFLQLRNEQGVFLDLRSQRFSADAENLYFSKGQLWIQMQVLFRESLLDLYKGYYQSKPKLFDKGLTGIGLMNEKMSAEQKEKIKDLFLKYFGEGDQTEVRFSTEHFVQGFEKIFRFIAAEKLEISAQFLYLGIYLASLYQHLQTLDVPLNVRLSYNKAMKD